MRNNRLSWVRFSLISVAFASLVVGIVILESIALGDTVWISGVARE